MTLDIDGAKSEVSIADSLSIPEARGMIQRAVSAERERCAKIADGSRLAGGVFPIIGADGALCASRIAYVLPLNWKGRRSELQSELDGRSLGRGNTMVRLRRA